MALDIKATYEKALEDMGHGFPLFSPGEVELGDVGFVDSDGLFHTFYNIANPPKGGPKEVFLERDKEPEYVLGPIHVGSCWFICCVTLCPILTPTILRRVTARALVVRPRLRPKGQLIISTAFPWLNLLLSVNQVAAADNVVKFKFGSVRQNSVVLIPWPRVKKESLKHVGNLEKYFSTHRSWLKTLCKELITSIFHPCLYVYITFRRESIRWDQLILVIGALKTKHWANAVNLLEDSTVELNFTIGGQGANVWGNWSGLASSVKMSPTSGK